MSDYEAKELEKLKLVLKAALANEGHGDELTIETTGHDPHARVRVKAYVFAKFLKDKL